LSVAASFPVANIPTVDYAIKPSRTFVMTMVKKSAPPCKRGAFLINGQSFDDIVDNVIIGEEEVWEFVNLTPHPHPIHVHHSPFYPLARRAVIRNHLTQWTFANSTPVPLSAMELGPKDTVMVESMFSLRMRVRFPHYLGRYVLHCHGISLRAYIYIYIYIYMLSLSLVLSLFLFLFVLFFHNRAFNVCKRQQS
jgi:FtsP/CotA-like multicopper oxidase with cupredoxin domain